MILSRVLIHAQERYDLEDLNAMLAACRTDAKLYTQEFVTSTNKIAKGFTATGIGLKQLTVSMTDASFFIPENTVDFSWFVAEPGAPDVVIPEVEFSPGVRNYVEVSLATQNNTPLSRAFWDPDTNGGDGAEFQQIVDTITDLTAVFTVLTGGFSGSPDALPLFIVDVDGSNNIQTILDRRVMMNRLALPTNLNNSFAWGTKVEPVYSLTMTAVSGVFLAGETISIGGETAIVTTGGSSSIQFNSPTGINFFPGDAVSGASSFATGTVNTVSESFVGVDKSILNQKDMNDALMTEFKNVKGTKYWWMDAFGSINGLFGLINNCVSPNTDGAAISFSGTAISITDDDVSPDSSDLIAKIRVFGRSSNLSLARADGTGSTSSIPISDGHVLFVQLPTSGDRTYSGNGSGVTNYQVVARASYVHSDSNYWLAYREDDKLIIRGMGELKAGETEEIGEGVSNELLAYIGAPDDATDSPSYSSTSSGSLNLPSYNATAGEDLTTRLSKVTAMLADLKQDENIEFDPGTIGWDGTNITIDSAQLSIPGTTVGAAPVSINNLGSTALANNSCVYVDIDRSSGTALTVATATLASLTPSQQRLVLIRRIGSSLFVR